MPTLNRLDGFEHGRTGPGIGDTQGVWDSRDPSSGSIPTIVTSPVRSGLRALRINPSAAVMRASYSVTSAASRHVTTSFYVRFPALPTVGDSAPVGGNLVALCSISTSQADGILFYDIDANRFAIFTSTDSTWRLVGPTLAIDTWYLVDMELDSSTSTFVTSCRIDGGTETTSSGNSTAVDIDGVGMGAHTFDETYDAYFDDWVISTTDGDYPIGAHSVVSLVPTSDGAHNIATSGDFDSFTATAFDNSTTNGNTFIGHRPLQVANTADQVVRQELGSTSDYMEFAFEDLPAGSDSVVDVRAYAAHVESAAGDASLGEARLVLSDNTEVLTTGDLSAIDSTEDPGFTVTLRKRMAIRPSGGWSRTKVDGLKARVGFADNAPDVNFIDFMLEVALLEQEEEPAEPGGSTTLTLGAA